LKNTFFGSITQGLKFLSNALLFVVLARVLGVEGFGRFSFALSLTAIFLVFIDYGFNLYIVKEVSVSPEKTSKILGGVFSAKAILTGVFTAVLSISVWSMNKTLDTKIVLYILWVASIFYSFAYAMNSAFRGLNRFHYEALPSFVLYSIQFILPVGLLISGFGVISVAVSYLVARIVYLAVSWYFLKKIGGTPEIGLNIKECIRMISESFPYGLHAICAAIYFQLDTVLISFLKGDLEAGLYQAPMRLVMASMVIYEIIVSAYFPLIAKDIKNDVERFKERGLLFNKIMFMVGGAISSFLVAFPTQITNALYGAEYTASAEILRLLAIVIFLRFAGGSYAIFITAGDAQSVRAIGVMLSVFVSVGLNLMLIPTYGAIGAAIASIITHIVLDAIYLVFALKITGQSFFDSYCLKGLSILSIGIVFCFMLKESLNISVFSYLVFLGIALPFSLKEEEKRTLRLIFAKITERRF